MFVVPPGAEFLVEGRGFQVVTGGAPPRDEIDHLWERFAEANREERRRIAEREAFATRCTEAMLPAVSEVVAEWQPELCVREPCEYASGVVAVRRRIPHATVGISFSTAEWSVLDFVADILDAHGPGMREALGAAPFLTRFPAALDPTSFPRTHRYRVPLSSGDASALPGAWVNGRGPRLYVTFGSRVGATPGAPGVFDAVLEAVERLDAQVLLTTGQTFDISTLRSVPANVRVIPWVSQEAVLPHCDAVICHGGSGTTFGALAHGVPVGFIPLFADQPTNARAVAGAGAGLVLEGLLDTDGVPEIRAWRAPEIRAMAEALLEDLSYRDAARRLATELDAQLNVAALADALTDWVAGSPLAELGA